MKNEKKAIILIILIVFMLYFINLLYLEYKMGKENADNIKIENKTIELASLTLRQKLSQMIIVRGDNGNIANVGGIFLDKQDTAENYKEKISRYQDSSKIDLLVATDLEGAWNPFNWRDFPKFQDIKSKDEAEKIGKSHGELLKSLGFNINFAPVSEYEDKAYGGRAFSGSKEEIKEKLRAYIKGLQENVQGVCKHYPGKGMIKNLHYWKDKQEISLDDLELFDACIKSNISGIMVGHQVVEGEIISQGKPASVSEKVIKTLPSDILIVSDEVNMRGLKNFYFLNKNKMYRDLINSGNNLILDFRLNEISMYKLIGKLEEDAKEGKINKEKIDESVRKILKLKGYKVR